MDRERIQLKFWQGGEVLTTIADVADSFWNKVQSWLDKLSISIDPDTAPLQLLNLLAWQRDISRWPNETEELYRKRVKYALANAKDAGSKAGFQRIWERIGTGILTQTERIEGQDWDIIHLQIDGMDSDSLLIVNEVIRQYGRTCRRYVLDTNGQAEIRVRAFEFGAEYCNYTAVDPGTIVNPYSGQLPYEEDRSTPNVVYYRWEAGDGLVYIERETVVNDSIFLEITVAAWADRATAFYLPIN